jgi:hypothetical protein
MFARACSAGTRQEDTAAPGGHEWRTEKRRRILRRAGCRLFVRGNVTCPTTTQNFQCHYGKSETVPSAWLLASSLRIRPTNKDLRAKEILFYPANELTCKSVCHILRFPSAFAGLSQELGGGKYPEWNKCVNSCFASVKGEGVQIPSRPKAISLACFKGVTSSGPLYFLEYAQSPSQKGPRLNV